MAKQNWRSYSRRFLSSWISLLILSLIALAFFLIGEFLHNNLFYGLAGVLGATALSLAITIITSGEAVRQQNAKDANLARKERYYVPLFTELKHIVDRLEVAKQKKLPYPQKMKDMDNEPPIFIQGNYPIPTFSSWVTFKEDPARSNFTEKACRLFDAVQQAGADYNRAVREAKEPVIEILNQKLDTIFREWANSDDFKHWNEETKGGMEWSTTQYHEWNTYIWRYMQRSSSSAPEAQSLVWAFNILGWVLVNNIDAASDLMHHIYQNDFSTHAPPDISWFKSILESVWTELQELSCVKGVHKAAAELLAKTVQAKEYMQDRLNYIRDMYEGGEPPL